MELFTYEREKQTNEPYFKVNVNNSFLFLESIIPLTNDKRNLESHYIIKELLSDKDLYTTIDLHLKKHFEHVQKTFQESFEYPYSIDFIKKCQCDQ